MKLSDLTFQHKTWLENNSTGSQIDLRTVTLESEQISNAILEGAIFDNVTFAGLEFRQCDFTAGCFFDCTFQNCIFIQCSFHKAEFHDCRFLSIEISKCSFTKTEWYQGELTKASFADCDFSWSYLQSVAFQYTQMNSINLEGVLWDNTKVYESYFESINFGDLHPANIQRTEISSAGDGTIQVTLQQFRELFKI